MKTIETAHGSINNWLETYLCAVAAVLCGKNQKCLGERNALSVDYQTDISAVLVCIVFPCIVFSGSAVLEVSSGWRKHCRLFFLPSNFSPVAAQRIDGPVAGSSSALCPGFFWDPLACLASPMAFLSLPVLQLWPSTTLPCVTASSAACLPVSGLPDQWPQWCPASHPLMHSFSTLSFLTFTVP